MASPRMNIAALTLSAAGLVGIVGYEGYTDRAVIPVPGDVPTIGFGTTENVRMGDRISPQEAIRRAVVDISSKESAIKRCVHVPLTQYEYDAYTSLTYNIGDHAFCTSTIVKKLNVGDYAGGCAEISRWDKQNGKHLKGLTNRRARERATCEGK